MIKEDVLQYLKENLYIIQQGNTWIISNKFTRELGISSSNSKPATVISVKKATVDKEDYKKFIVDAAVPTKIETVNGSYWANRYSETGFKAFKKVMENPAINRAILLAATKWYYAQTRTARKMIGTYFSEGIWESCYDDFVRAKANEKPSDAVWKTPKIEDENSSNMNFK